MTDRRVEFVPPVSLEAGKAWRNELVVQISDITLQLGARRKAGVNEFLRRHPLGVINHTEISPEERQESEAFAAWRTKALGALRARERTLRQLNAWLADENRQRYAGAVAEASGLLQAALDLFEKLRAEEVGFDAEELELIERLHTYMKKTETPQ